MQLSDDDLMILNRTTEIISRFVVTGVLREEELDNFKNTVASIVDNSTLSSQIEWKLMDKAKNTTYSSHNHEEKDQQFENDYEFITREDGIIIRKYVGFDKETISIPDSYRGRAIIGIRGNAFANSIELKTIVLGVNVVFIGEFAFAGCSSLETIQWNNAPIVAIGEYAFKDTSLKKAKIPEGVKYIGEGALSNSKCIEVYLPDSLSYIAKKLFCGCNELTCIRMPSFIYRIGESAFSECSSLQSIQLNPGLFVIEDLAFKNCKRLHEIDIPSSVQQFGKDIFTVSYVYRPDRRYNPRTYYENLDITIFCNSGSAALKYARAKGLKIKQSLRKEESNYWDRHQSNDNLYLLRINIDINKENQQFYQNKLSEDQFYSKCDSILHKIRELGVGCFPFSPYILKQGWSHYDSGHMTILIFGTINQSGLELLRAMGNDMDSSRLGYYLLSNVKKNILIPCR